MGDEEFLTLTVKMAVRPESCVAELMHRYKMALQLPMNHSRVEQ